MSFPDVSAHIVGSLAKQPFTQTNLVAGIFTFSQAMNGFVISNDDGALSLTFAINGDTYTVKAGEVFSEKFPPFTQVTVTATGAFRAYGLL